MQTRPARLRAALASPGLLLMPGVFDGYSTRLVEGAGYKAGFISGAGVSESSLGWADMGLMGLEENLRVCRSLAACSDLPLLADGDTGYGNALNTWFTVRAFEQAGVAGLMIEDQTWPKRCGHLSGKSVIEASEMVEKVRAATEARRDTDFVIKARTDAYATHGLKEAIDRLNRFKMAGADLLMADAVASEEDLATLISNVDGPVVVNMGLGLQARATGPLISPVRLAELGAAAAIYPRMLTASAVRGMQNALAAFAEALPLSRPLERTDLVASFADLNELTGLTTLNGIAERHANNPSKPGLR